MLPAVEIETSPNPSASVIWLHGLGANGHDFEPIIPELQLPADLGIRFIFPHAPSRAVTINGGMSMPAWYDIMVQDIDRRVDLKQLLDSVDEVAKFIDREVKRGIPSERIVIAGFSQGGAVGYQLALSYPQRLGGLLTLSTYFATAETIEFHAANKEIDIFIAHGLHDPVVPELLGKKAHEVLREAGYKVDYKTYPMDHSVCLEEIQDISRWLQARLG